MFSVSSWWIDQILSPGRGLERELVFYSEQGSGYNLTPYVTRWPTIKRRVNEFKPADIRFEFSKATLDSRFGWFTGSDDSTLLRGSWQVRAGYTHPLSGPEMVTVFKGRLTSRETSQGVTKFGITGAGNKLTESRVYNVTAVGSQYPVTIGSDYTNSQATPGQIAWTICTCYAKMDATASTANSEVSYAHLNSWTATFTAFNVTVPPSATGKLKMVLNANGEQAAALVAELVEQSHSIAWLTNGGKLAFRRLNGVGTAVMTLDARLIANASYVQANENAPTRAIGSYLAGPDDAYFEYVTSTNCSAYAVLGQIERSYNASAIGFHYQEASQWRNYFAPNITLAYPDQVRRPYTAQVEMPGAGVMLDLGDEVTAVDTINDVSSFHWLVHEHEWDMQENRVKLKLAELLPWFATDYT